MTSKLIIELERIEDEPVGIVGLGHDLNWVTRDILTLPWNDSEGNPHTLGECYRVGTVRMENT